MKSRWPDCQGVKISQLRQELRLLRWQLKEVRLEDRAALAELQDIASVGGA